MKDNKSTFVIENNSLDSVETISNFQKQSLSEFMLNGFPTKTEDWLYWQPEILKKSFENPIKVYSEKSQLIADDAQITLINGISFKASQIKGTKVSDLNQNITEQIELKRSVATNSLSLLNSALCQNILFIEIHESQENPIIVDLINDSLETIGVISPRLYIKINENVSASVLIRHKNNLNENVVINGFVEVKNCKSSNLEIIQLQTNDENNRLLSTSFDVHENAKISSVVLNTDGNMTRHDTEINVLGENANVNLKGLGLLNDKKRYIHHLSMTHHVTNTFGDQVFKNILSDEGVAEFSGLVNVKAGSHETISNQLNQNLILSDKARALSRPQLIIDADDVECSHGCTIGQLDDEQIHYLKSRGFSEKDARSILIYGFAKDIADSISNSEIRKKVETHVKNKTKSFIENNV